MPMLRGSGWAAAGVVGLVLTLPARAPAVPSWWVQLRSTGYAYQTVDADGARLDRFGAYQGFSGAATGLAGGRLTLRMAGRFADDLYLKERTTTRGRLYAGQLEARPGGGLTARLGRQFVQEGVAGLTLDGLWLAMRLSSRWDARLWGGARAPLDRDFEIGDLDEQAAWGARVVGRPWRALRLSASCAHRERDGRVAARPVGLEAGLTPLRGLRATGRVSYDFEGEEWERAEVVAQWQPAANDPVLSLQVVDRRPLIDAASYFARFSDVARVRVGRASLRYEHASGYGTEVEYVGSFVEERTATRLAAALIIPIGRLGYSARLGDAGEESRWYGELTLRARPWLWLEGGASLATYALLADVPEDEERELTAIFGRVRACPRDGVGVSLEVQSLENPRSAEDVRLLAGLDLTMGRGAGRFGIDHGGWLR